MLPPETTTPRKMRLEYLLLVMANLVWGSSHPTGKVVLREISPLQFALARTVLAFAAMGLLALRGDRLRGIGRMPRGTLVAIGVLGLLGYALTGVLGAAALTLIPAGVNGLLVNTSPIFVAAAAPLFLGERLTWRTAGGILVAFAGVVLVTYGGAPPGDGPPISLLGVALSLAASVCWAAYTVGGRTLMKEYQPVTVATLMSFFSAVALLGPLAFSGGPGAIFAASPIAKLFTLYIGVVNSGLSFALWYYCLKRLPAANVAVFQYLAPVFAVILSHLFLGEAITPALVLGLVTIIGGIRLVQAV